MIKGINISIGIPFYANRNSFIIFGIASINFYYRRRCIVTIIIDVVSGIIIAFIIAFIFFFLAIYGLFFLEFHFKYNLFKFFSVKKLSYIMS